MLAYINSIIFTVFSIFSSVFFFEHEYIGSKFVPNEIRLKNELIGIDFSIKIRAFLAISILYPLIDPDLSIKNMNSPLFFDISPYSMCKIEKK